MTSGEVPTIAGREGPIRTIRGAAGFVRRAGIVSLFPMNDLALPSLWEAVAGGHRIDWAVRDDEGKFSEWTPEFARAWRWKSELPERKLVCVGKHFGSWVAMISLDLLRSIYALTGRSPRARSFETLELAPIERDVAGALWDLGPRSTPELRKILGVREKRRVESAIDSLQKMKLVTAAGATETGHGWPALTYDLLARRYADQLKDLPSSEEAYRAIAGALLRSSGELSAADLTAITRWKRLEAEAALDDLVAAGTARCEGEGRMRLWTPVRRSRSAST